MAIAFFGYLLLLLMTATTRMVPGTQR